MIKKTNTLVSDFHFVSKQDDAVDASAADFEERWQRYLDGMADPPLKPGETPTTFVLKHLTSTELDAVRDLAVRSGGFASVLAACALGLKAAKNWEDGKDYAFRRETSRDLITPVEVVVAEDLNKLDGDVRLEIGSRVLAAATPRPN